MKAARVLRFGPPSVITNDDLPQPDPAPGQLLVRVKAAGVGNWDALIREGRVKLQPLPLTLGAELSGIVETIGANVSGFQVGDAVYGATNAQFSGAYAEYAVPLATMMARKPKSGCRESCGLSEGASRGVADWSRCGPRYGRRRHAAAVASCAEARWDSGLQRVPRSRDNTKRVWRSRSLLYVAVATARLTRITELFDTGTLVAQVGTVLPLEAAHIAHEMLGGAPHKRGKIVLRIAD